jgi:nitric oxide reductase NorE protein
MADDGATARVNTDPNAAATRRDHLPGEEGVWLFIGGDLVLFSLLFGLFLFTRGEQREVFDQGRALLNQTFGLLNTLLMLSSSWFVASAVQSARRNDHRLTVACFGAALLCGAGFIVVKFFEYGEKLAAGITLTRDDFFQLYFIYTGIHLLHVLIGMGVLTALCLYSRAGAFVSAKLRNLESGASFWHLVDLLWIVLFALLYLVGAS